jgi:hypothetical protein
MTPSLTPLEFPVAAGSLNRRILLGMNARSVLIALASISVGIAVALLWDPTVCMYPAIYPAPHPETTLYCNHQYVPRRLAIAITGVLVAVLVLTVRRRRLVQRDRAQETG